MTAVATIAGVGLIALALRDVFDTLFHPHGRGIVSERLVRAVWTTVRRLARGRPRVLSYAGPVAFLTVVLTWVALVVLGFALITAPHLPDEYVLGFGVDPEGTAGMLDAVYFSLVNMTSLGYGDIVAESDVLRLLGPLETVAGLGLLTASISWILSIYGVLGDYRSVSHEIALLCDAEEETGQTLSAVEAGETARLFEGLTAKLVAARRDLLDFPIAYFFHSRDPRYMLSLQLPRLVPMVEECRRDADRAAVRLEAARLKLAIDDLLATLADEFMGGGPLSTPEAIARYRHDQGAAPEPR